MRSSPCPFCRLTFPASQLQRYSIFFFSHPVCLLRKFGKYEIPIRFYPMGLSIFQETQRNSDHKTRNFAFFQFPALIFIYFFPQKSNGGLCLFYDAPFSAIEG